MFQPAGNGLALLGGVIWFVPAGVLLGMLVGATPGLGSGTTLAILLPVLVKISPEAGLVFSVSIYAGAEMGGAFPATLVNIPGTHSSAISTLDGYPMALKGEASRALGIDIMASTIGALFGGVLSLLAAPLLARLVLQFSPVEICILVLFGIAIIGQLSFGGLSKGILSGCLGLFLATIGTDPMYGQFRGTFGFIDLIDGLPLVPVLIGVLGFSQILSMLDKGVARERMRQINFGWEGIFIGFRDVIKRPFECLRGSAIGGIIGLIPGAGGTIVAALAYQQAYSSSSPEKKKEFGKGAVEGMLAVDTAHNAMVGGALVPLLTLGIPGSSSMAVLLIILSYHGLAVGPTLFAEHSAIVYAVLWSQFVAAFFILIMGTGLAYFARRLANVSSGLLAPVIAVFCLLGSFANRGQVFDMAIMFGFGVLGFFLKRHGYSAIALVLGLILGPTFEANLFQGLAMGYGSPLIFFTRPLAILLWCIFVLTVFGPYVISLLNKRSKKRHARSQQTIA